MKKAIERCRVSGFLHASGRELHNDREEPVLLLGWGLPNLVKDECEASGIRFRGAKFFGFCSSALSIALQISSRSLGRFGYLLLRSLSLYGLGSITDNPCSRQIRSLTCCSASPECLKSRNLCRQSSEVELKMM